MSFNMPTSRRTRLAALAGSAAVAAVAAFGVTNVALGDGGSLTNGASSRLSSQANGGETGAVSGGIAPTPEGLDADAVFLSASLAGENEVPPDDGRKVNDPDGSGAAVLRIAGTQVCYSLGWSNIDAPTLGHIHAGKEGVNGDLAAMLFGSAMPDTVRGAAGCVTADKELVEDLKDKPEEFYANLHNEKFDGGAVRGQFQKLDDPVQLVPFLQGDLLAVGDGTAEVPEPGDAAASFLSTVTPEDDRVTYALQWSGFDAPTLGHIHKGEKGTAGKPVVDLFKAEKGLSPELFAIAGVSEEADADVVRDIAEKPGDYYVNVHTALFPAGAARGQLQENKEVSITGGGVETGDTSVVEEEDPRREEPSNSESSEDSNSSNSSNSSSSEDSSSTGNTATLDENVAVKSENGVVVPY